MGRWNVKNRNDAAARTIDHKWFLSDRASAFVIVAASCFVKKIFSFSHLLAPAGSLVRFLVSYDSAVAWKPSEGNAMSSDVCEMVEVLNIALDMFVKAEAARAL